jgi:hypothetical protein
MGAESNHPEYPTHLCIISQNPMMQTSEVYPSLITVPKSLSPRPLKFTSKI